MSNLRSSLRAARGVLSANKNKKLRNIHKCLRVSAGWECSKYTEHNHIGTNYKIVKIIVSILKISTSYF